MILYHGSYLAIEKPDLSFSRITLDFGRGFYTTPIKVQTKKWSKRFISTKKISTIKSDGQAVRFAPKNNNVYYAVVR
jgi:hypothetical protein